jgi:hypothetical protein
MMITDTFVYLAIKQIERLTDTSVSQEQREFESQQLEQLLRGLSDEQLDAPSSLRRFMRSYLDLSISDFEGLTLQVHVWFLERLSHAPQVMNEEDIEKLVWSYFFSTNMLIRYLAMNALLAHNQNRFRGLEDSSMTSSVNPVFSGILQDKGLSNEDKVLELEELIDILLDINSDQAYQTLETILIEDRRQRYGFEPSIEQILRTRISYLRGQGGERLRHLLGV